MQTLPDKFAAIAKLSDEERGRDEALLRGLHKSSDICPVLLAKHEEDIARGMPTALDAALSSLSDHDLRELTGVIVN